jgi:4a-hydroxytetrahydrobiopterin dehydratase
MVLNISDFRFPNKDQRLGSKFARDVVPKPCKLLPMAKLPAAQIETRLAAVPGWKKRNQTIQRTYQFKDFPAAIRFVNAVARLAEMAWHHPDIDIRWNKVTLVLTTHDAGGLTEKDFQLARKFDRL